MIKMLAPVAKAMKPAAKVIIKLKKPEVMAGAGGVLVIIGFVWAAVSGSKAPEVMAQTSDKVRELEENNAEKKDIVKARVDGVWQMTKLFGPPALCMVGGLGLNGFAVKRLVRDNVVLGVAAKGWENRYKFFRGNVAEKLGEKETVELERGVIEGRDVELTEMDGTKPIVKTTVPVTKDQKGNPWRLEYSPTYFNTATGDPEVDLAHLIHVGQYFTHLYMGKKKYGQISNYEILDFLDPIWEAIDPTGELEMFHRNYGYGHKEGGDDFVDLGVYRSINEGAIRGIGDTVWLELNSDGKLSGMKNKFKERYRYA